LRSQYGACGAGVVCRIAGESAASSAHRAGVPMAIVAALGQEESDAPARTRAGDRESPGSCRPRPQVSP